MRTLPRLLVLLFIYLVFSSHEFWLQPDKFIYQRGESIRIRFYVGENFEGENWRGNRDRVNQLRIFYGGVSDDLTDQLGEAPGDSLQLQIFDEGNPMVVYNGTNSFISLKATDFNNYLEEDGLSEALRYRAEHNQLSDSGREYYQRCSKTLLQIGSLNTITYRTKTNLPLDIIPIANPYQLTEEDSLGFRIFFQKQPLAHTLIKTWHRENETTVMNEVLTDENGECRIPVSRSGAWMISVVKMVRLENDPVADWQSYWGSFTWGYE